MARYLSREWFDEVNEAARTSSAVRGATAGVNLVLQQVVTGTADGELRYWLRIDDGSVEAGLGLPAGGEAAADATVTQSYETAVAVMRGELSTEEAFLGGHIRLRGDIGVLLHHQSVLNSLGQAFDEVHQRTEYG
ncbi:MAG TPA: SCP2 sterol-binding domain-containing protein [Acidimicrobiales bacterium]|nr:SCP2 sterol-binding domain-containing protein [Acidimicrobiales bacterium]